MEKYMGKQVAIEIKNVSKKYRLFNNKKDQALQAIFPFIRRSHKDFFAVKDINLVINKGDILGIIGRNGSGKSTLMKLVAGVIQPSKGTVTVKGNLVPLLELGSGFHREFTGFENIYFYTAVLGYPKEKILEKTAEIIEFADVGEFINQPLKNYSSGMKARLAFSVSVSVDPDILILDEVLSVGDAAFKVKSYEKIREFFTNGKTILFVSHSLEAVRELCNRAILIDSGQLIMDSDPASVIKKYNTLLPGGNKAKLFKDLD
jgi:ABC-type polysaccharide/polyol phosphate transport system ATPase subunit